MWKPFASFILRNRVYLLVGLVALTAFMAYQGRKAEILQEFVKVIPEDDADYQQYLQFKELFGEDGNAVIIGLESDDFFTPARLNALHHLSKDIAKLDGVERVLNIAELFALERQTEVRAMELKPIMPAPISSQAEADSIRKAVLSLPFYKGIMFTDSLNASLILVSLDKQTLVTEAKHELIAEIEAKTDTAMGAVGISTHYSGVPYLRSYINRKLPTELAVFMALAALLTALALYVFYRSSYAVVFPIILISISAIGSFGIVGLLGFKLSLITALIPPMIVILSIPASIYMLSDYHLEYQLTGQKVKAMHRMLSKLGMVTLMINANTALGFLILYFTNVIPLREFGLLAFLSTTLTYIVSITLIPGVFSLLPPPSDKKLKHLDYPLLKAFLEWCVVLVTRYRHWVYAIAGVLAVTAIVGITQLKPVSYMVDDLPQGDKIRTDLAFIESEFDAAMPFEIVVDGGQPGAMRRLNTLRQMDQVQRAIEEMPTISRTVSLADAVKWTRQAYYRGVPSQYTMPGRDEFPFIASYSRHTTGGGTEGQAPILQNLVDSTYQYARITGFVQDVGSQELPAVLEQVYTHLDSAFLQPGQTREEAKVKYYVTGTTRIFIKANDYLVNNLTWTLVSIFILVGLQMLFLFRSPRIMIISMLPNMIPLAMTAGIMGYMGIPLKPSTALIYGIAFTVAIDDAIHFLASYRYRRKSGLNVPEAVVASMRNTGMSIIYTSVVLFSGFTIFAFSEFGSTEALGVLMSITLFIAMFANLILLPVLIIKFNPNRAQEGTGVELINPDTLRPSSKGGKDAPVEPS